MSSIYVLVYKILMSSNQSTEEDLISVISSAKLSLLPVIIRGPIGCGKSRLINIAASKQQENAEVISLFVDSSTDPKSLVGSYVSGKVSGEFVWNDGILIDSIKSGKWLVIENFDHAPPDVLCVFKPLIMAKKRNAKFLITELNTEVDIHPDFMLFGTCSASKLPQSVSSGWLVLDVPASSYDISNWGLTSDQRVVDCFLNVKHFVSEYNKTRNQINQRQLTFHDFVRLASRLSNASCKTERARALAASDAFAVLAGHHVDPAFLEKVLSIVSKVFDVYSHTVVDVKPAVEVSESVLRLKSFHDEEVALRRDVCGDIDADRQLLSSFTFTSVHSRLLWQLARSPSDAVLLSGDTGCGKTSTVQWFGRALGKVVSVYNFSDQSEASQLFGSLQPVVNKFDYVELVNDFKFLLKKSFSEQNNVKLLTYIDSKLQQGKMSDMVAVIVQSAKKALETYTSEDPEAEGWRELIETCASASSSASPGSQSFEFVEGLAVTAIREGHWLVLDEINLAPVDVLQRLSGLLEVKQKGYVSLKALTQENCEDVPLKVHPDFRLVKKCFSKETFGTVSNLDRNSLLVPL